MSIAKKKTPHLRRFLLIAILLKPQTVFRDWEL